jgi:recombination protein RecT
MTELVKTKALSPQQQNVKSITGLMEQYKGEIAKALPKHLSADRMARIALTCIRVNPKLAECDPLSFMGAIIQASALGLEPGSQGHAYLIPFKNTKKGTTECQFIPGYRGLIDLARRSGQIESLSAQVVREKDDFEYEYGLDEKLFHKPARGDRGDIIYVYAVAKLKDGGRQFEVMDMDQIQKIRNRARYANPVWESDFDEMCRKTAVRRLYKYLPTSVEMRQSLDYEEMNENQITQGNRAILDATYTADFEPTEDATTIPEINKKASDENESANKKAAINAFEAKMNELRKIGWKEEDFCKRLNIASLNQLFLTKNSEGILAALEVLRDAAN